MTKNKKITYILIVAASILAALTIVFILNSNQILQAAGITKSAPVFIFNDSKVPGWWAADNYNSRESTDPQNYEGSEPINTLPVASMNIFKGNKGEHKTACFVMFSYYDYKVDVVQLKKDKQSEVSASTTMKGIGEDTTSIILLGETKNLTLMNYELIGPDAENAMKGMSYGWVDLKDGYVSVSGVCPTSDELGDTMSVITAISLVKQ